MGRAAGRDHRPPEAAVLAAVGKIYAAALNPTGWLDGIRAAAELLDADSGLLQVRRASSDISYVGFGLDPDYSKAYLEHFAARDPYSAAARSRAQPGEILWDYDLVRPEDLRGTEIFEDLLRPQGIFGTAQNLGGVVHVGSDLFAHVQFTSRARRRYLPQHAAETLRSVVPHIRRALEIQARLSHAQLAESAVDQLRTGLAFVDRRLNVLRMNQAANAMVRESDGLLLAGGRLRSSNRRDQQALQLLVEEAYSGIRAESKLSLAVRRQSGKPPYSIVALPIERSECLDLGFGEAVALFISDPTAAAPPPERTLMAIFGLTPAEARCALLISDGRVPKEVAQALDVSINTVRTLLKRVFAKTGVDRQAALVRLIGRALPPLRGGPC